MKRRLGCAVTALMTISAVTASGVAVGQENAFGFVGAAGRGEPDAVFGAGPTDYPVGTDEYGFGFGSSYEGAFGAASALPQQAVQQRAELLATLRQLQDAYCRAGMLDEAIDVRNQIRALERLQAAPFPPIVNRLADSAGRSPANATTGADDDPGRLFDRIGETFYGVVTGRTSGSVWGVGPYTADSDLATAAVHAGALNVGETKAVKFTMLPGRDAYESSIENGVSTAAWGSYGASYRIDGAAATLSSLASLTQLRGQGVERLPVFVVGDPDAGPVWGSDVYTDDSSLAAAAVHAGLLKPGERGIVTVELLAGRDAYEGEPRHGVESRDYGPWQASFRFLQEPVGSKSSE